MRHGFISTSVIPARTWYVIDENHIVTHKGISRRADAPSDIDMEINYIIPEYWALKASWYDTLDLLCEAHSLDMI